MTVTFVRHAESQGNASGFIDTSTPGPHLTNDAVNQNDGATGEQQALGRVHGGGGLRQGARRAVGSN